MPKQKSNQEVHKLLQPVNLGEVTEPTGERANMNDIVAGDGEEEIEHDSEELRTNRVTPKENDSEDNGKTKNENPKTQNNQKVTHESNKKDEDENKDEALNE